MRIERLIRTLVRLGWRDVEIRALLSQVPSAKVDELIKQVRGDG